MDEATSLFKFKAGKSRLDGKLLVADTRKGMVEVFRVSFNTTRTSDLTSVWLDGDDHAMTFLAGPGRSCTLHLGCQTRSF